MNIDPNKIKEVHSTENPQLIELVYGDSVIGDSLVETNQGKISIETLFNEGTSIPKDHILSDNKIGHEYVTCNLQALVAKNKYKNIKYIMRHKCAKDLFKITTTTGKCVVATEDHSLITPNGCETPKNFRIGDLVSTIDGSEEIQSIEHISGCEDYVYDVCIETTIEEEHRFVVDGIICHNTDSLYMSFEGLLNTIEGVESWSDRQKAEFLIKLSTEFINPHNHEFMSEYFKTRHARSMTHEFEAETLALSGVWLDVKKRYGQMLLWKDGKFFDEGEYPVKVKGLEIIKASFPAPARKILKKLMHKLLSYDGSDIHHVLNKMMQEGKQEWMNAPVESISPAISVNNYNKYITSDNDPQLGIQCEKATPFAVRGLAYYNWLRQTKHLPGDPIYGGKLKYYIVKELRKKKKADQDMIFTFMPSELPTWAEQYAPIDREALFKKCVLDPMNRILSAIGHKELTSSGYIDIDLFDLL